MSGQSALNTEAISDEIQMEKNAGLIMGTNNSSIVSKRSVEKLYLPEPHFYRYFVRKFQRRSPTINRGYWLRMRAVEWVVRQFLANTSDKAKVVINMGCGYDPLPFQWLTHDKTLCEDTKFIDVDYELLMETKRDIINSTPKMRDLLNASPDSLQAKDKSVLIDSPEYAAIGCDLRNLPRLERLLKSVVDMKNCLILCVAEVSITYMHSDAANALVAWSSALSTDVTFCLLEQCSPDRADNPFTATMMKHFAKLGTPLHSMLRYPDNHSQIQRFREAGFTHVEYNSLWDLWSDPRFISPSQRLSLDQVEPFDEWEEFALFASHYCLVVAHNRSVPAFAERPRSRRDSVASMASDISARTVSPYRPEIQWFAYRYCKDAGEDTKRHHASSYPMPDQDAIGVYGGIGPKARLSSTAVYRPRRSDADPPTILPVEAGARCCHTVTGLGNGHNLLVGGRGSPSQPMKDCWIQIGHTWSRIHDLPEPRYRHRTVPVTLPDGLYGAVVFGGKTGPSRVAIDTLLWEPKTGWRVLRSLKNDPIPRFGPSLISLGFNHGLLFGGMRQDGIICQGLWRWRLIIRNEVVAGISFRPSTALDASVGAYPWFARLGAGYNLLRDEILIIGGIAKAGCIPQPYEILSILGSFSAFNEDEREMDLRLTTVTPAMPPDCPRPFYIGHSSHRTRNGMSIIIGGGATCFSFGNYFNSGVWVLHERDAGLSADWTAVAARPATKSTSAPKTIEPSTEPQETCKTLRGRNISNEADFMQLVRDGEPQILISLDFGSCVNRWSLAYLRDTIRSDRTVTIHNAPSRTMNFQRKDFKYENLPFDRFLTLLNDPTSHLYLRSLASSDPSSAPANFSTDWPELSPDFHIPAQLRPPISSNLHSSPLRVSNDIGMWLHYDVMANVLFQIRGVKKLVLFPPTDLPRLSFPPGSTTSDLDVFPNTAPGSENAVIAPAGTSPHIAILHPGDALFIPPLWSHAGLSLPSPSSSSSAPVAPASDEPPSTSDPTRTTPTAAENPHLNIAINLFFRDLPLSKYASGRDVYGNRDLAAYEDGRRDVDKIVRRFLDRNKGRAKSKHGDGGVETGDRRDGGEGNGGLLDEIPRGVVKAYLQRLAGELIVRAEELGS